MKEPFETTEIKVHNILLYYYAYIKYIYIHHFPFWNGKKIKKAYRFSLIGAHFFRICTFFCLIFLTFQEVKEISEFGFQTIWSSSLGHTLILQVTLVQIIMVISIIVCKPISRSIYCFSLAFRVIRTGFVIDSFLLKSYEFSISMGTFGNATVSYHIFSKIKITEKSIAFIAQVEDMSFPILITCGLVGDERKWRTLCDYFSEYRLG